MTQSEIEKTLEYFNIYSEKPYITWFRTNVMQIEEIPGKWCTHKEHDDFKVMILETGEVYQLNTDHEPMGIELETLKSLQTRFKSFTGEEVEVISEVA